MFRLVLGRGCGMGGKAGQQPGLWGRAGMLERMQASDLRALLQAPMRPAF